MRITKLSPVREIDLRNAQCRAQWTLRYYSRSVCMDAYPPMTRLYFDLCRERLLRLARAWMRANVAHRPVRAPRRQQNIIPFSLRKT